MSALTIRPCAATEVAVFEADAKRAGLTFATRTEFHAAYLGDRPVGMCGMIWHARHCKVKDLYVLPEYRRQGYMREMLDYLLSLAAERGIKTVEATCTPMSLQGFLRRGFTVTRQCKVYTGVRLAL